MRLLIADDDPSLRLALRMVLEDAGHEVVEAATEPAAREALASVRPDFALIDAGMSGRGVELWRDLRATSPERVLLLTGDAPTLGDLAEEASVVSKPFDFDRLLARIESVGARS